MKRINTICLVVFLSAQLNAQSIIDSCFLSVSTGTNFVSSAFIANTTDADLLNWTGSQWTGQWPNCNLTTPPPCPGGNQAGIFMGDQTVWTSGGEGAGFLLSAPLVAGQTYSFSFTYVSDGFGANGAFSPSVSTNNIPDYATATLVGNIPPAGYMWLTSVYSFTATAGQAGHDWLIVHSNNGSGILLNNCSAALGASLNLGNDTTLCIGDSIQLNAGSNFTVYNWSTGDTTQAIMVTNPGTYTVFVVNSCGFGFDSVSVNFVQCNFNVNAALASSDTSFCEKQCIDFTDLSTNIPTSWQWFFQGGTPDTSTLQNPTGICYNSYGSFEVKLIACNSLSCDTIALSNFINEYQNPTDSIWQSNDTLYSLPFSSYQWYETASGLIAGATDSFFVMTQTGNYYCIVRDSIGCEATSNSVTPAALNDNGTFVSPCIIHPNPGNGIFNVESISAIKHITVYNTIAQKVFDKKYDDFSNKIQFAIQTTSGIYSAWIETVKGNYLVKFVVK